jgi:hypothetical protein
MKGEQPEGDKVVPPFKHQALKMWVEALLGCR